MDFDRLNTIVQEECGDLVKVYDQIPAKAVFRSETQPGGVDTATADALLLAAARLETRLPDCLVTIFIGGRTAELTIVEEM